MKLNNSVKLHVLSSLEKLYHNERIPNSNFSSFSMLRNEKKSFQIVVESDNTFDGELTIESSLEYSIYSVEYIKSDFPMAENSDDYFRFSDDGYYPDLLVPINDKITFQKGNNAFWIEIFSSKKHVGNNDIKILLTNESDCTVFKHVSVEVIDCDLDFKDFIYTNWFHSDCLSSYYNVDVFSDEYWRITKNFLQTAADYGMNCVLTPLFTPPLDTEIGKERPTVQLIDVFVNNRQLLANVASDLSNILDVERLSGRIAMSKAHAKDLQALKNSLLLWTKVKSYLNQYDFSLLESETSDQICHLIANSILEDPATSLTDGGIIKQGWSQELDKWRDINSNFNQILSEYEQEEKEKTGISTLRIKNTGAYGYFIEVSKGKLSSVPSHFIMRRSLVNGDRYTTEKLQDLEKQLNESSVRILELERDLFLEIRDSLIKHIPYLLQIANEIANTDVIISLSLAAIENNWIRPQVEDSTDFEIIEGRHPVVEKHIPIGEFVPNNSKVNSDDEKNPSFNLITGPNMAGKSTYLRQNALICLLAQIGSYVPAKFAKIGVVDKIFCRVGASDNLAKGESTFLVEMTETAHILHSATKKSLSSSEYAYIIVFPTTGTLRISTRQVPQILPSASREITASQPQLSLTQHHFSDCEK